MIYFHDEIGDGGFFSRERVELEKFFGGPLLGSVLMLFFSV